MAIRDGESRGLGDTLIAETEMVETDSVITVMVEAEISDVTVMVVTVILEIEMVETEGNLEIESQEKIAKTWFDFSLT